MGVRHCKKMRHPGVWIVGIFIIIALLSLREYFDPFLILYVDDVINPKAVPLSTQMTEDVTMLLYGDTRPHIGKIDGLQKGLVLEYKGLKIIEEGYGFGLPIIIVDSQPYSAMTAEVEKLDEGTLVKRYSIDTADRWTKFLQVKYQSVPTLGEVVVTYTLRSPETIAVDVNFTGLNQTWDAAYVMNEQGARAFPIYEDSKGERRHGDELGIWHPDDDVFGCWLHRDEALRFCIETQTETRRFVGRERYNQYNWVGIYTLSWSGIDIEILPPMSVFTYTILVESLNGN